MFTTARLSRRSLLGKGLAVSAAGLVVPGCADATVASATSAATKTAGTTAAKSPATRRPDPDLTRELRALEKRYDTRLGVYARNVGTGQAVRYRGDERFPMCSTFKGLLAAHMMRDYDRRGEFLERVLHYTRDDLAGWSPITENNLETGMAVRDLCLAATAFSDNGAANVLLRATDGPPGFTRFCRAIGDEYTRLDRYETDMSEAKPGDDRDTTTPEAMGRSYARLVLGRVLKPFHRDQLVSWLKVNTTSGPRFRAGLPDDWVLADKTGNGGYGTVNDIGIVWTPKGTTLLLSVLSTKEMKGVEADPRVLADTARLLAGALTPGESGDR
ncbi:beta-lactamase class A [Actinopolymorpha cephalotaxi]|uniref:Beta-lactamase n=1 Tax=Actinopolymorpha cephalotaxi TaxID=504797 RepID=A0A1I2ZC81_9ACTN|nr:class A beta-lactamase [Actinopolymorpha cephalotaxi]NYH81897.1 beta-lactamase class A [Actinopolymorpha cephalotaxi]SFH35215.1 beta-lactamase class A [Actinopolymorpha cephalotaxi]